MKISQLFIITNAAEGWVEYSAKRYLPKVSELIPQIKVLSARTSYESMFPGNSHEWKMRAFLQTLKDLEMGAVTNLIALGDSKIEMDAAKHLATQFPCALIKTVKF